MNRILSYLWKLLLCSLGFFIGIVINGLTLDVLGYQAVKMFDGAYTNAIVEWFFMGSILMGLILSFFSRNLKINWLGRWIIILELFWLIGISGSLMIFSLSFTMSIVTSLMLSLVMMCNFILPGLLLSGLVTVLFQPSQPTQSLSNAQIISSQVVNPINL